MHGLKVWIEKIIPGSWLSLYHMILANLAAFLYGYPSNKLIVVGVTGTNGKTTTAYLIAKALEANGPAGCTTTAIFKIAEREWLNDTKMTMLGRFALQKYLSQMVKAGCKYAVIETSSQGILQHRHEQVAYDIGVFTNLTPEHIEAHGGFENYKQAKIKLFKHIAALPPKKINGQIVPRALVLNRDDQYASDFAIPSQKIIWYGLNQGDLKASNVKESPDGISFDVDGSSVQLQLMGRINAYNALAALAVCQFLGVDLKVAAMKLGQIKNMPGRFEKIEAGQPWKVIVDYAPEPESLKRLYQELKIMGARKVIHVLGSCGGGRDVARRPVLGQLAAKNADYVIVTNEDPYDDDPMQIIRQVADGAKQGGKLENENLFLVLDRTLAIQKAMSVAEPGDLVLLTGKGSEQRMCVAGGRKIPWDDREAARSAIKSATTPGPSSV